MIPSTSELPFFSIIITTYNRASFLPKAIDSVLKQRFAAFECIIVDDGSTDNTKTIIQQYQDPRIKYHYIENHERGYARNHGIQLASGQYIAFLDSDDYYKDNHLLAAQAFIQSNNQPAIFFQRYDYLHAESGKFSQVNFPKSAPIEALSKSNVLCPTCALVKKSILVENPFDNDRQFTFAEDLYVWLKIGSKYGILFSDETTCVAVDHAGMSMNTVDPTRVEYCRNKIVSMLQQEAPFKTTYKKCLRALDNNLSSLAILLYTERGLFFKPLGLCLALLVKSPSEISRKRTYVIFRNLLFNSVGRNKKKLQLNNQ